MEARPATSAGQPTLVLAANKPPATEVPPSAPEPPMEGLEALNGVVVLGSYAHFSLHGVTNAMDNTVLVDGPDFLKKHEKRRSRKW